MGICLVWIVSGFPVWSQSALVLIALGQILIIAKVWQYA